GLFPPSAGDQYDWFLRSGDELLLATDGLFEQFDEPGRTASRLPALLAAAAQEAPLLEAVSGLVEESLRTAPQRDDITAVSFCRRVPAFAAPHARRLMLLPELSSPEADDP